MINIICALQCEARPLIDHYGLQHKPADNIKLYQNAKTNLVVSGVGGKACASAVKRLAEFQAQPSAWLNIGIAGHGQLAIGTGRMIHKITGPDGLNWYPPSLTLNTGEKLSKNKIDSISLITVDKPEKSYPESFAYDMEAAYFYQAAIKHQTSELVQCYKIISDNNCSPTENINANKVSALIGTKLPDISNIIDALICLHKQSTGKLTAIDIAGLINDHHFSHYQKIYLVKLLERLSLLTNQDNVSDLVPKLKSSSQVLNWLENKIKELPVKLT